MTFAVSRTSLLTTTLIPAGYFDPGIRVILVITVNGVPTPVIDRLITRQEVAVSDSRTNEERDTSMSNAE